MFCCICGIQVPNDSAHYTGSSEGEYLCNTHDNDDDWFEYCRENTSVYDSKTGMKSQTCQNCNNFRAGGLYPCNIQCLDYSQFTEYPWADNMGNWRR